jgi:hypothetical protein
MLIAHLYIQNEKSSALFHSGCAALSDKSYAILRLQVQLEDEITAIDQTMVFKITFLLRT